MMQYIRSASVDAAYNLALEQFIFEDLPKGRDYLMLWQNKSAVIVGKHQNTAQEINGAYVKAAGIQVVRRLSGGGAVYHDMGNINFTFIADAGGETFDFAHFCRPIVRILEQAGVHAEIGGRNDMTINGMKFSGNSQYIKQGRVMHHGTILFDADLSVIAKALNAPADKYRSKGLPSIKSRVTNIRPHLRDDCDTAQFYHILEAGLCKQFGARRLPAAAIDDARIKKLQKEVYSSWSWNYGASPGYQVTRQRRIADVGLVEVYMNVDEGIIRDIAFYGDYFATREQSRLADRLRGLPLSNEPIRNMLKTLRIDDYFTNMSDDSFITLLV